MSKLAALLTLIAVSGGCAPHGGAAALSPSASQTTGDGFSLARTTPPTRALDAAPMPSGESAAEAPDRDGADLAQARALGCWGIR